MDHHRMVEDMAEMQGGNPRPGWSGAPVTLFNGKPDEIRAHLPVFAKQPFALRQSVINPNLDTIVRQPLPDDMRTIPVGTVSKKYTLIQHSFVFDMALKALESGGIKTGELDAELTMTEYGERMGISFFLPKEYSYGIGSDDTMAMRLECFNSVDGSIKFQALLGWYRFVCSNGLIVGITRSDIRCRHSGEMNFKAMDITLARGISEAKTERENFSQWQDRTVSLEKIQRWTDEVVYKSWGLKAAARVFNIAATGFDADILTPFKGTIPSTVKVRPTVRVPGSHPRAKNIFDLSQILAWIARTRNDFQERSDWRQKIPEFMHALLN